MAISLEQARENLQKALNEFNLEFAKMMVIPRTKRGKEYRTKFNLLKTNMDNISRKIRELEDIETDAEVIILTGTTTQPLSPRSYGRSKRKKRKSRKRRVRKQSQSKRRSSKRRKFSKPVRKAY
jgi:hypothetical protein